MSTALRLLGVALTFSLFAVVSQKSLAAADAPPNIVLIIADDLGWEDCRPFGNQQIKTTQLERLAREGMRFENMILTCSSCSPSRASLIT